MEIDTVRPTAAHTHISGAQRRRQFPQPGIAQIDWGTVLKKIRAESGDGSAGLPGGLRWICSGWLTAVRLPESSAGDFYHLDVVRVETFVDFADCRHLARIQNDPLGHQSGVYARKYE